VRLRAWRSHKRSADGLSDPQEHRLGRFFGVLLWSAIPALALALVAAYIGLAVERHVNPPVVPVEGRSMNPLLHFGDLVFLKKTDTAHLHKGDIIAFRTTTDVQQRWNVPDSYVHRIVTVEKGANGFQFQTKGDNVPGKDPFWTVEQNVIGVYAGKINGGGFPILFFRSRQGKILVGGALLIMFLYWLLGVFERRRASDAVNVNNLATIVEEARRITRRMEEVATAPRPPPNAVSPEKHEPEVSVSGAAVAKENQETMRQLVGAIGEYGQHLQSHTAVMVGLAATTAELQGATMEMRGAITASPRIQPVLVPEMPHLKKSVRGYSRKAVRKLYDQMSTDLEYTRRTIERLDHDIAEIREDRDRLARDLTQAQQLQASLAASLALAEERLRGTQTTPTHNSTKVDAPFRTQPRLLASIAAGAIGRFTRRFGAPKSA
jgi:signal peptidase I